MNTSRLEAFSDGVFAVGYAASIGLAFVSAWLVIGLYGVTAIYYAFNQIPWMESEASS